ncbi:unnamed protein product [Rotaria sp. Silwood1]|nr:unnamed protein product [Rotaria sp. Silwood1]
MALLTRFTDLPDLVLIELFSHLSSIDILWAFTCLNHRLKILITEQGFFYHINLSLRDGYSAKFEYRLGDMVMLIDNIFLFYLPALRSLDLGIHYYVMPILQRTNVSLFININDLNHISSSSLFIDHRHVDVHFAFNLINGPQYKWITQYIPCGNRFHPREIIGTTFVINHWSNRSEWLTDNDRILSYCSIIFLCI